MDSPTSRITLPPQLDQRAVAALVRSGILTDIKPNQKTLIDGSAVTQSDGAGVAFVWTLREAIRAHGGECEWLAFPENLLRQLNTYTEAVETTDKDSTEAPSTASRMSWIVTFGRKLCDHWHTCGSVMAFVGEVLCHVPYSLHRKFRMGDALLAFVRSGAEAVPVVSLIGFLLGLILAFQSAVPLQMFGAESFVGGLVGIAVVRELGLIITAILMAGRTASAFAAELGTMKVNEEIDALETMGIAPVRFLVLPRVLAGTFALPFLALFATASGLLGGWLVMHLLGFPTSYFIDQLRNFVAPKDLIGSECKAFVFGFVVSAVGCWFGLRAGRDARAVGSATTSAVVTGIVFLAVLEGFFSVVFYAMGW